jgi:NAD+ kinase
MRFFVLGTPLRANVREEADRLVPFLRQHAEVVVFDLEQKEDLACFTADIALVLGGDGAILRAARQMCRSQVPVLGINLGKLGFLADHSPEQFRKVLPQVLAGNYRITSHLMFDCTATSADGVRNFFGLNDVVIQTGPPFQILEMDLLMGGVFASRVLGDGLIVSTPVGSTAHGLSAGGPILGQELRAFVVTPICPHSLTSRAVVDAADKEYTIVIRKATNAWLIVDGQDHMQLHEGDRVTVNEAPVSFQLVKVPGHSFYGTLQQKLNWGITPNYRNDGEQKKA